MTGLMASFLIPLLRFYYRVDVFITQSLTGTITESTQAMARPVDTYLILFYFYIFCGTLFVVRQLFLLLKINSRIRSAGYTIGNNYRLVDSPDTKVPFSFYNYIFFNSRQNIAEEEKQLIFAHERSHILQRHWIDLIIAESICVILWFNPFVWFYLRSIRENHEYLADEAVIRNGYSSACYRAALINQSLNTPVFSLANSFAYYKFKRIFMMKKETSNPLKKLAVLLLVPVAGFFFWAFSEPEYHVTTIDVTPQSGSVYLPENEAVEIEYAKVYAAMETEKPVVLQKDTTKEEVVVIGVKKMREESPEGVATGEDITKEEIVVIGAKRINATDTSYTSGNQIQSILLRTNQKLSPLILIDGKETSVSINDLDPSQIESISVLKNASAASLYDDRGKNGVILITTKRLNPVSPKSLIDLDKNQLRINDGSLNSALILIDGKETSPAFLKLLEPEQIESITIYKNESAVSLYGEKAKNGVIEIKTKKNDPSPEKPVTTG
jgi:TonB-dependent SusC/RagA subfamily outer membrane receptor